MWRWNSPHFTQLIQLNCKENLLVWPLVSLRARGYNSTYPFGPSLITHHLRGQLGSCPRSMVFSATCYLELCNAMVFTIDLALDKCSTTK